MNDTQATSTFHLDAEQLLQERDWDALRQTVADWPAAEVARVLRRLPASDQVLFFRALHRQKAADVFAYLAPRRQEELLDALTDEETQEVISTLSPDDRTQLLHELPAEVTQQLMDLLPSDDLAEARTLLGYPEESVGRLMTPDYVAVRPSWTIEKALTHVRKVGIDSETINRVYVVNADGVLVDDLQLRKLILADPEQTVQDVMDGSFVSASAFADREEAVRLIKRYDVTALPVLDSEGVLVGIVTVDDLLDVAEQEATEDFHRVGSVEPIRGSLQDASTWRLYRSRIGWLLVLVFINIFSGEGIAYFEDTIMAVVALVFFLPLLIDSAGNAGSQAATLMVRALATGDVKMKDWFSLVGKELGVAVMLGATMALAVSVLGWYRGGVDVAVVVAMTMVCVVIVGSLVGMSLPFLLNRFNLDPATASAPLVTSIADISGVLIYFSLATWYLGV